MKEIVQELVSQIVLASKSSKPEEGSRVPDALFDSIAGLLVRSDYDVAKTLSLINDRLAGNLFDPDFLEKSHSMKLQDMWRGHEDVARNFCRSSTSGLGTPNAAAGGGELFLLMSSSTVSKPKKGDATFCNGKGVTETIELKRKGKIGSNAQYQQVNDRVVKVCKALGIDGSLPVITKGANKGKKQFLPNSPECQKFIESQPVENRVKIWQAWWNSQNIGSCLPPLNTYTWSNEIMWEWIRVVVDDALKTITGILIIKEDGSYIVWRSAADAIDYYKTNKETLRFEFRAAQSSKPAFYVPHE